jgi:hypothetical protein
VDYVASMWLGGILDIITQSRQNHSHHMSITRKNAGTYTLGNKIRSVPRNLAAQSDMVIVPEKAAVNSPADTVDHPTLARWDYVEIVMLENLDCVLSKSATRPYIYEYKCECVRTHLCIDPSGRQQSPVIRESSPAIRWQRPIMQ